MQRNFFHTLGPSFTPKIVKILILLTTIFSILCAIQVSFFPDIGLYYLLSLSLDGIKHGFIWQPFSYVFLVPTVGLSTSFLIHLFFNLYLLWVFGESLITRSSIKKFLFLFFFSGFVGALGALVIMALGYPGYMLAGSTTVIYGYLLAWIIANPYAELSFFFTFPIKAKWLLLTLLGLDVLFALAQLDLVAFVNYLFAASVGYSFGLIEFSIHSPFGFLQRLEKKVLNFTQKRREKRALFHSSKVYDIKTGKQHLDDEQFMDAMLMKISVQGEKALSWKEKRRMKKISKNKKNK